ncbi:MAG: hypothetical protein RLY93_00200 [Sumerlaeia bacterium]
MALAGVGDFNGDGLMDFAAGAPGFDADTGAAGLILGGTSSLPNPIGPDTLTGANGFWARASDPRERAGTDVAAAGDVNGDGFADLLIGSAYARGFRGAAYLIFGSAAAFPRAFELDLIGARQGTAEITLGTVMPGDTLSDRMGTAVAGIGDFNGDGYGDFAITAALAQVGDEIFAGRTFVLFGRENFTGQLSPFDLLPARGGDGSEGFVLNGALSYDQAGQAIAGLGDINGDGFADFAVGAPYTDATDLGTEGKVFVLFGRPSVLMPESTLGALSPAEGFVVASSIPEDRIGFAVAAAGDVNGDGLEDFLIGAPRADGRDGALVAAGKVYIVFGRSVFPSRIDAAASLLSMEGASDQDFFAQAVTGVGDWTGDGFADILIGAPRVDSPDRLLLELGQTALIPGAASTGAIGPIASTLTGTAERSLLGQSLALIGDHDGDGRFAFLAGAPTSPGQNALPQAGAVIVVSEPAGLAADGQRVLSPANAAFLPVGFAGGASAIAPRTALHARAIGGTTPVTLNARREAQAPRNLPDATPVRWRLEASDPARRLEIRVALTAAEVAGLLESRLALFSAPAEDGPWTPVAGAVRVGGRLQWQGTVTATPVWLAIAERQSAVVRQEIVRFLLGIQAYRDALDVNRDGVVDSADMTGL